MGIGMLGVCSLRAADDMTLYVPNSKAPLEPRKSASPDISVNHAEAEEMRSELGGILYMAQHKYSYGEWPGKEMSDCRRPSSPSEEWCYQCQLIMGHASADYYFYKEEGTQCTLQQVDARFQVADRDVLRYLRRPPQALFGESPVSGSKRPSKESGWDGRGDGWVWDSNGNLAFLYMNMDEPASDGEGTARFQWRRAPLSAKSSR